MNGWTKKRRIMGRYDVTAHLYDMRYGEEQTAKIKAALENISVGSHRSVLDVGCGTGILFRHVVRRAENVIGLDISKRTLMHAKERAKDFSNVQLVCADADNMPFRNNEFHCVFAFTLIQNTPKPHKTLDEIKRVSQADSTVVVTGLKNRFPVEPFETMLKEAGFGIIKLVDENDLKCYVAICARLLHKNRPIIR
jgi:ubiquinone/menaquinone biosynthesis C-methylase UbiE